jgi:1-acyl-sn-glycerol-3-phosphate acyltransferase
MAARSTLIILMTFAIFGLRLLFWPTSLFSEPVDRRLRRAFLMAWNRGFARIANVRIIAEGPVPRPPFFLVANHLSYLDMVVLTSQTGCIYVARGDVEHWPVVGFLSKSMYVIFIDRKSGRDTVRVNRLISHAIEMGDAVAMFAESRISAGKDVEPFKSALIEPAVAAKLPVYYATLGYETLPGDPPASEIVGWWRPESFLYHLGRLLRHRGVIARVRFGDEPLCGDDRKELAPRLHAAVRANFTPLK